MWTVDANSCRNCSIKKTCKDRAALLPVLSQRVAERNAAGDPEEQTGDGVLVLVCNDVKR